MTAPVAAIAAFVQPAAKLAMGDSAGAALGGFEALLAMLTQSLDGGAQGTATPDGEVASETTDKSAGDIGDLAALLGQTGAAAWLTQAMSQATPQTTPQTETEMPITCATPQAKDQLVELTTNLPEAAPVDPSAVSQAPVESDPAIDALMARLQRQAPEAVDPAILDRIKPVKGQTAAQTLQSLLTPQSAPAPAEPVVEAAVVAQVQLAAAQATNEEPTAPETVAAPAVIAPPVEAKAPVPPRKAAPVEAKAVKTQTADAAPAPTAVAAAEDIETPADEIAPVEVAAREAEAIDTPVRNTETAVQTLGAKLETVSAGAASLAAQVRGAPETVAKLAAGILDKLEGQSTKFDLQLDPHGLGKVDVSVEIASDGKLTAQLGFDSALGMSELRGRAQELRTALEQAGFSLADNALSFDFTGERRQQTADGSQDRTDQAGKAFARAMGALDEELAAVPTRYQARRGLDLLI